MTRVLITGGTGCIGAAAAWSLGGRKADEIVIASRSGNPARLQLWFGEDLDARLRFVTGDVSDEDTVRSLVREVEPTHVIHLGALQTPDCDAHPWRGMEVNVGGTLRLLDALAESGHRCQRLVFASSAGVYGARSLYPGPTVSESEPLAPPNLYGVWKVAGEHLSRLFHRKTGIPTVCLRLNTTYGKGRDLGKTAAPTQAMKSVAAGYVRGERIPFRMPYVGRENYHYVGDVGAHFAAAALEPFSGFGVFNIRGRTLRTMQFLDTIAAVACGMGMADAVDLGTAEDAEPALFIYDLDDRAIQETFSGLPLTPLEVGIERSLEAFAEMARAGKLERV